MTLTFIGKNIIWLWGICMLVAAVPQPNLIAQNVAQDWRPIPPAGYAANDYRGIQPTAGQSYFDNSANANQIPDTGNSIRSTRSPYNLRTFGGWSFVDVENDFNRGWALGGSVGRYIRPQTRLDVEFTYRNNAGDQGADVDGYLSSYSFMTNLVYELNQMQFSGITPYIGGGIGASIVNGSFTDNVLSYSVDDAAFAYQGIAGVQRTMNRNVTLFGEYRFFGTTNVDFSDSFTTSRSSYQAENVFIGVQLNY